MLQNILDNLGFSSIQDVLIWVFVLCISLSFHEMAHAWQADRLGDDTARRAGRLSLNPLVHLDPIGTIMMFIAHVGWAKPVPINPVLFKRSKTMKRGIVEVSLAGPLSNLLLSVVSFILYDVAWLVQVLAFQSTTTMNPVIDVLMTLFGTLFRANIYLAIFNLLPFPPLDGYKIFGSLLPNHLYYKIMDYERYIGIALLVLIYFAGSVFGIILNAVATPFIYIISTPIDLLFNFIISLFK